MNTNIPKNVALPRKSNLELCRIICMLLIIAHHCVVHGGAINMEFCENRIISLFLLPGGKLCFDAFLALSTWFLVEQKFKAIRFCKIWSEVFFYSVLFAGISLLIVPELTKKDFLSSFLPITGNSHGFASAYLALYLLLPFLSKITASLNKFQAKLLIFILIYLEIGTQIIGLYNNYYQHLYSELLLFILCYFIAFYLKHWPLKWQNKKFITGGIFLITWLLLFMLRILRIIYPDNYPIAFLNDISGDESSILNLIGGYSLFLFFNSIQIPTNKIINYIAKTTFGILLIHDHNFFRAPLWNRIVNAPDWYYDNYFVFDILITVILIFVICMIIDLIRIHLLERPIFKWKIMLNICGKIDRKINSE